MTGTEEAKARAEAATLCAQLRERGDDLSLSAAAMIEGTLEAFADLVEGRRRLCERAESAEANEAHTRALWSRVPYEVRMEVVHGPRRAA